MSTTTDRKTASAYSGVTRNRGTVLEISAGQIDNGASISFLSQYPGEAEFLMPPLCSLEVPSLPGTDSYIAFGCNQALHAGQVMGKLRVDRTPQGEVSASLAHRQATCSFSLTLPPN